MRSFDIHRIGKVILATVVVFAAGVGLRFVSRANQIERVPFTAIAVEKANFRPDGTEIVSVTTVQAQRSNGSKVSWWRTYQHETDETPSDFAEAKRIYDLDSRWEMLVFPLTESVSSVPISDRHFQHLQEVPKADCDTPGGTWTIDAQPAVKSILGYRVVHRSTTTEGGVSKLDEWVSPRLGCISMRLIWRTMNETTGEYETVKTVDVTSVAEGEPDPDLFGVPEGFTERSPWEELQESARRRGKIAVTNVGIDRAEQRYHALRAGGAAPRSQP